MLRERALIGQAEINSVLSDPDFRIGFEFEFQATNAANLIRDQNRMPPAGFRGFKHNTELTLKTLTELIKPLADYLGISSSSIKRVDDQQRDTDYSKWNLKIDTSIYSQYDDDENHIGLELTSPIQTLDDGIQSLLKISDLVRKFNYRGVKLNTTDKTGLHINISHLKMKTTKLDFTKLAFLSNDEHYLDMFGRIANEYAAPVLTRLRDDIRTIIWNDRSQQAGMFRTIGIKNTLIDIIDKTRWSITDVLDAIRDEIYIDHRTSTNFEHLDEPNPYVEFRMAGGSGYESRMDDLIKMILRFAALIRIGLDPSAHRREYLIRVWKLLDSVIRNRPVSAMPDRARALLNRVRIYLKSIMSVQTQKILSQFDRNFIMGTRSDQDFYLFLSLLRIAYSKNVLFASMVRKGLGTIMHDVLHADAKTIAPYLRDRSRLLQYGVLPKPVSKQSPPIYMPPRIGDVDYQKKQREAMKQYRSALKKHQDSRQENQRAEEVKFLGAIHSYLSRL